MRARLALFLAAAALGPGCLSFPDRGIDRVGQRRGFACASDLAALQPGSATRADVLCTLGEPDWSFDGGRRLVYWTREVRWRTIAYVVFDAAERVSGEDHLSCFEFDPSGRLAALRQCTRPFSGRPASAPILEAQAEEYTRSAAPARTPAP